MLELYARNSSQQHLQLQMSQNGATWGCGNSFTIDPNARCFLQRSTVHFVPDGWGEGATWGCKEMIRHQPLTVCMINIKYKCNPLEIPQTPICVLFKSSHPIHPPLGCCSYYQGYQAMIEAAQSEGVTVGGPQIGAVKTACKNGSEKFSRCTACNLLSKLRPRN